MVCKCARILYYVTKETLIMFPIRDIRFTKYNLFASHHKIVKKLGRKREKEMLGKGKSSKIMN